MKVYGQLEKSQLENLASDPATSALGYAYYNTVTDRVRVRGLLGWYTVGAYDPWIVASTVIVTPSGNLSSTDVQAALLELQGDADTVSTLATATAASLASLTTSSVAEGLNLYYTDVRADARIALQKAAINGLATLDAGGKIPSAQLPALAITDTFVVGSQAAMLALTAEVGDIAIRTDLNESYILQTADATVLGHWQNLMYNATATVASVNGYSGIVVLTTSDIAEGTNLYYTTARFDTRFGTSFAAKTTADLAELTNLYFTTARARSSISASAPVAYNSTTGVISTPNFVGDSGSGGTAGLVPAPATGDTAANKFLSANGSWDTVISGFASPMTTLGDLIYGGAAGAAARLAGDTSNTRKFLRSLASGSVATAPVWDTLLAADVPTLNQNTTGTAANATNTAITDDTSTASTMYLTWVTTNTGNLPQKVSSTKLSFVPSTGILTASGFSGPLTGTVTGHASLDLALTGGALTGAVSSSYAGTSGIGALLLTGAPYAAGNATTNKPHLLMETSATSTGWDTGGTFFGINYTAAYTGKILDFQVDGSSRISVGTDGQITQTNGTETVKFGMSASNRWTINNTTHASSTFFSFGTNTGYIGLGVGSFNNSWQVAVTNASTNTSPLTNLVPNTSVAPIFNIRNSSATANNWGALVFSGNTDKLISAIYSVTTLHTAGSETGELHFTNNNAGTKADVMVLSAAGALKLNAYTTQGALRNDTSGNVTSVPYPDFGQNYVSANPDAATVTTGWTTYADTQTATMTLASPAVVTVTSTTGFYVGMPFCFTTTGALPTGVAASTLYYVSSVVSSTTFQFSATPGGTAINSSVSQSGTHTFRPAVPVTATSSALTGLTFSRNTTTPLRGAGDFKLAQTNSTVVAGQGVYWPFTIDIADKAKVLSIQFDFNADSNFVAANGTTAPGSMGAGDSDLEAFVFDVTAGVNIPVSPQTITANGSGNYTFKGTFQTGSTNTSYRLCLHAAKFTAAATGYNFRWTNVYIGPQNMVQGTAITDPVAYTPTFTGFGTVTVSDFTWSREGVWLVVSGRFTPGTSTATEARISLPTGLTSVSDYVTLEVAGLATTNQTNTALWAMIEPSVTYMTFGYMNSTNTPMTKANGSALVSSGGSVCVQARIRIAGWGSTTVMSNDTDTRVVSFNGKNTGTQSVTSNVTNIAFTSVKDTHAAWSGTVYTVPVAGDYVISGAAWDTGSSSSTITSVYKNGTILANKAGDVARSVSGAQPSPGSVIVPGLVPGDTIALRIDATNTITTSSLNIYRLTGPSAIAATEKVYCQYTGNSGAVTTASVTDHDWSTKVVDTHNAFNGTAFTAPRAGWYNITGAIRSSANQTAGVFFYVYVNAVQKIFCGHGSGSLIHLISASIYLKAGDALTIRNDSGFTEANSALQHVLSISSQG